MIRIGVVRETPDVLTRVAGGLAPSNDPVRAEQAALGSGLWPRHREGVDVTAVGLTRQAFACLPGEGRVAS